MVREKALFIVKSKNITKTKVRGLCIEILYRALFKKKRTRVPIHSYLKSPKSLPRMYDQVDKKMGVEV